MNYLDLEFIFVLTVERICVELSNSFCIVVHLFFHWLFKRETCHCQWHAWLWYCMIALLHRPFLHRLFWRVRPANGSAWLVAGLPFVHWLFWRVRPASGSAWLVACLAFVHCLFWRMRPGLVYATFGCWCLFAFGVLNFGPSESYFQPPNKICWSLFVHNKVYFVCLRKFMTHNNNLRVESSAVATIMFAVWLADPMIIFLFGVMKINAFWFRLRQRLLFDFVRRRGHRFIYVWGRC